METMRADADRWLARGWRTVNGDHRDLPCGQSLGDVVALYDRVRTTYGASRPICIAGQSSGGHLALMVAALRRQVSCVISQAGLTDLTTLAGRAALDAPTALRTISNASVAAFGGDRLGR